MAAKHKDAGVELVAVNARADESVEQVAAHAKEYGVPFRVLKDDGRAAVAALGAKVNPEAFVLDHNLVLRYRGRIDDAYSARLKAKNRTTRHDLSAALDALLAGKAGGPADDDRRRLPHRPRQGAKKPAAPTVTYHRDVLPILQANCQPCHRPGEVGPFALMTYKQAANWADDIKEYTPRQRMPPWKPRRNGCCSTTSAG